MDVALEGTIDGWPAYATLQRNPGEKWCGIHAGCYTDKNDNSAPELIRTKAEALCRDFENKEQAIAHLRRGGFICS